MRFPRKLATFAALAGIAVGASACYEGNQNGPIVGSLGDSITALATNDLNSTLGADYRVNVQGEPGYSFGQLIPELQTMLAADPTGDTTDPPTDFVVEGGPNDIYQGDQGWQNNLNTIASDLSGMQCVIYVNVSTLLDAQWPGTGVTAEQINAGIDQVVANNPNSHVLDWNGFTNAPGNAAAYLYQDAPYLGTDIHPNPDGQQVLANMEQAAIAQDCPA